MTLVTSAETPPFAQCLSQALRGANLSAESLDFRDNRAGRPERGKEEMVSEDSMGEEP